MRYYLGLDNGGTTTKAALYDEKGNEKGFASVDTRMLTPRPGFTERDMDEMWEANCADIREVLKKTGIKGSQIRAIAICGHGKGLYLWGKDDRPVRNGIISTDNRAWEYPIKIAPGWHREKGLRDDLPACAGLSCQWPCWPGLRTMSPKSWIQSSMFLPARIMCSSGLRVKPGPR